MNDWLTVLTCYRNAIDRRKSDRTNCLKEMTKKWLTIILHCCQFFCIYNYLLRFWPMVYNNATDVRIASWFDWNYDITDDVIEWHITDANNVMMWMIWSMYDITGLAWSNFTWSHGAGMLKRIECLLASGNLLADEYGPNQLWTPTDGEMKIEKAMQMIEKIMWVWDGPRVRLLWVDWTEFTLLTATSTHSGIRSTWFVGNTSKFSVDDEF